MLFPVIVQRRERQIRQELEKKEESTLEMKERYTSLQEEIEIKTKKLLKVVWRVAKSFFLCVCDPLPDQVQAEECPC